MVRGILKVISLVGANTIITYWVLDGFATPSQQTWIFWIIVVVCVPLFFLTGDSAAPVVQPTATFAPSSIDPLGGLGGHAQSVLQGMHDSYLRTAEQLRAASAPKAQTAPIPATAGQPDQPKRQLTTLQAEAVEINKMLRNGYKLPVKISISDPKAITETPAYIMYRLDSSQPFALSELSSRSSDLAREIMRVSRRNRGELVRAFVIDGQPPYLQVSKPTSATVNWDQRPLVKRPLSAAIGVYWEGPKECPIVLDMYGKDSDYINGLFCGMQGSGKSTDIHAGLISLFGDNGPDMLEAYLFDAKNNAYSAYSRLPHVKAVSNRFDATVESLKWLNDLCLHEQWDGVHRLLVIDEFQEFMREQERRDVIYGLVHGIMSRGRSAGIRVWLALQVPKANFVPTDMKGLLDFYAISRIDKGDYVKTYLGIDGANQVEKRKEFIFDGPGFRRVALKFYLPEEEKVRQIDGLMARWGGYRVVTAPVTSGYNRLQNGSAPVTAPVTAPVRGGYVTGYAPVIDGSTSGRDTHKPLQSQLFPLDRTRQLTDQEAMAAYRLWQELKSQNKTIEVVFGGKKNGERAAFIKEALERGERLANE